ncbi:MAG: hypothetical protein J6K89_00090 [Oscillospiraceae bacterium]|nr:hypothetical protein [Oscillospiraceae bacterium]
MSVFRSIRIRKILCPLLLPILIAVCFSACDLNAGTRPFDYPNSHWVCETPEIRFEVGASKEWKAYLGSGEAQQEFQLLFGYGTDVDAIKAGTQMISSETILFQGHCAFSEDHFTISLSTDNLWNGEYHKLHFQRVQ